MSLLQERPSVVVPVVDDETGARRTLRSQIARLEHQLTVVATTAWPHLDQERGRRYCGPRVLSLGELEQVRDELAGKLSELSGRRRRLADEQADKRLTLERMLLAPAEHKWQRISAADIGEQGCKHWHVRPRLGPVGMLKGWWHVKVSSGCPLAWGPWRSLRPRSTDGKAIS